MLVAVLYLAAYILVSAPGFQNALRDRAEKELSALIGSEVEIGSVGISPFNEVVVRGLTVYDRQGSVCLRASTVGAGINLWRLMRDRRVELTYGEIIGLEANIVQHTEGGKLNIQFIIDAFKPKDRNRPPARFDLTLRNVVLRRCALSFDCEWKPRNEDSARTDFNHFRLTDLRADIAFPAISNDDFKMDLRRLSFAMSGGLIVDRLSFRAHVTPKSLSLENFVIKLPSTDIRPSDILLRFDGYASLPAVIRNEAHRLILVDNEVTPSDFAWLEPGLASFREKLLLSVDVAGKMDSIALGRLDIVSEDKGLALDVKGAAYGMPDMEKAEFVLDRLTLEASHSFIERATGLLPKLKPGVRKIIGGAGAVKLSASGSALPGSGRYDTDMLVSSGAGDIYVKGETHGLKVNKGNASGKVAGEVSLQGVNLGLLTGDSRLGIASGEILLSGFLRGRDFDGEVKAYIPEVGFNGMKFGGIVSEFNKEDNYVDGFLTVDNEAGAARVTVESELAGADSHVVADAEVSFFRPGLLGMLPQYKDYSATGRLHADLLGDSPDNLSGHILLDDFSFFAPHGKSIGLDRLFLSVENLDGGRVAELKSDWLDARAEGDFRFQDLQKLAKGIICEAFPSVLPPAGEIEDCDSELSFSMTVKPDNTLTEFFNLPFRFLVDIPVKGAISGREKRMECRIDVPFIQQGKNKLVRDTWISLVAGGMASSVSVEASTTFPAKKGDMILDLSVYGRKDNLYADVGWKTIGNSFLNGELYLGALLGKDELSGKPEVKVDINPSVFEFGTAKWNIDKGSIRYDDGVVEIDGLKLWHGKQFVNIEGRASALPEDSIKVRLADIDIAYIFDTLNINYVTFGGIATGEITAKGALGPNPVAGTDNLEIASMSYNGTVLGDGALKSRWNNEDKEVEINAEITGSEGRISRIDGGIWVTRDSLSFEIDADRVPVGFLGPFMSAFTSDVKGHASGKAKLFGTFSDIDLVGRVLADSVAIKLDYTNVYYHGTDSIYLDPGKIVIPSFRLYDREGHSAILSGELTHRYFHDPRFNFRISDVRGMLCYDTNAKINPDWYGTIYGNGHALVRGWPGVVSVSVDMTTVGRSAFTLVLNETRAAEDYRFLTFSDRAKEERERLAADSVSPVLAAFRKKVEQNDDRPSNFMIDIRGTVTPTTLMRLVMDPVAGDKIEARGNGNIQVDYDSESDEMQMFGKYILDEGNYNFSLQDLILRDFSIRQGSSISFNGDPFNAQLDITANYRVNTNLSDLDKSFSTDRDLARTNVPVDAVLMVDGELQHPDISFDIELPTLTQDVERKVKSIVSTDDMMSRQIIYLLALNRFYTPEYMGSTSNGGEFASVASSTLSSQLSNMLGQLSDKFTVAPSFRSDKGDFSDIEVDVALSSRLLNNRLLINGNFGYRDRSTSQTTFVGDFDIEYLLSRSGNLRLKAYNHFNDQNYYLRSALTTQGLGIVFKKDFNHFLPGIFRRKRSKSVPEVKPEKKDTDK